METERASVDSSFDSADVLEERLTVKEYAARHRVHVQTVYSAIRYGRLKARVEKPTGGRSIRIVVPRESI